MMCLVYKCNTILSIVRIPYHGKNHSRSVKLVKVGIRKDQNQKFVQQMKDNEKTNYIIFLKVLITSKEIVVKHEL
jgi:hypothetical protein